MKTLVLLITLFTAPYLLAKTLTIGSAPLNPPFETLASQPNHFFGFDIDLMIEICKRINLQCDFIPMPFDNLFSSIQERKIDLAIAAITITPAREAEFLFSLPYLESNGHFLALRKSAINTPEEIAGKKSRRAQRNPLRRFGKAII
ncbi:transporter substrate-binding domain-containing protein [Legionella oakridgensis]|uniref:Solute-binding protein family 3/N-terminal domain-containing protein n=2 Tax=Legionella oakridgensis TaxID=29423 RepID=A0A0W0XGQ2_9GAMM|nr:transporter substrate-binding domain-containing protein [Legionella oakridgensis]KTD43787.1 hypothetical protein Loak_0337 [Legionella oakridgensis]STY15865.1 arginine 3rd transport system periplasmic binding protein [Legionella longbeachae]